MLVVAEGTSFTSMVSRPEQSPSVTRSSYRPAFVGVNINSLALPKFALVFRSFHAKVAVDERGDTGERTTASPVQTILSAPRVNFTPSPTTTCTVSENWQPNRSLTVTVYVVLLV